MAVNSFRHGNFNLAFTHLELITFIFFGMAYLLTSCISVKSQWDRFAFWFSCARVFCYLVVSCFSKTHEFCYSRCKVMAEKVSAFLKFLHLRMNEYEWIWMNAVDNLLGKHHLSATTLYLGQLNVKLSQILKRVKEIHFSNLESKS